LLFEVGLDLAELGIEKTVIDSFSVDSKGHMETWARRVSGLGCRMRKALSIVALTLVSTGLVSAQESPPPPPLIPGEEVPRAVPVEPAEPPKAEPAPSAPAATPPGPDPKPADPKDTEEEPSLKAIRLPIGVRSAKPVVPKTEQLIRDSEKTLVAGDQMWLTIDHPRGQGVTSIDIDRTGQCFFMERRVGEDRALPTIVRGGRGVPASVRTAMLNASRRKGVLYGLGRDRLVSGGSAERMRLGISSGLGRSVHTSQSFPIDVYPDDVRSAAKALLDAARKLPVLSSARGIVSAEFVPPQQARRLTVLGGNRLIAVRDPGKEATELSPVVAAGRMPGRRVVVTDAYEWEQIQSYLTVGGTQETEATSCLISLGAQVYRLYVEPVGK
jgi:hypothetical protein